MGFLFCLLVVSSCFGKCEVRLRAMLTPDNTSEGWQLYAKGLTVTQVHATHRNYSHSYRLI